MSKASVSTEGVGTESTGYADASYGPFRCGHCVWFSHVKSGGRCAHPEVRRDPQVPKDDKGLSIVDQDGCCNEFRPTRKIDEVAFEKVGL